MITEAVLYGDGIHDDYAAIQTMLDSRRSVIYLPAPKNAYLVGDTLRIYSNQTLLIQQNALIRQKDGTNKPMLRNADGQTGDANIAVCGGIWDLNNMGQQGNAAMRRQTRENEGVYAAGADYADTCNEEGNTRNVFPPDNVYNPNGFVFENVQGLVVANLTLRDPVSFSVMMGRCSQFQVEDIIFDFNDGNPLPANMDGIHLEGGCHHGIIRRLRGTVYDDMVALNADELIRGDISHILIDDLYARHAHSAVRLLSSGHCVHDITISNVRGSYFTYAIGFTKYFKMGNGINGRFENIEIRDCEFSKSDICPWFRNITYPLFYFQQETQVCGLRLKNIHRTLNGKLTKLFGAEPGAVIADLTVENVCGDMNGDAQNIADFVAAAANQ